MDFELEVRTHYRSRGEEIIKEKGGKVRGLMGEYKDNLFDLYGYFKEFYESLSLQKIVVENNYRKKEGFLEEVERIVAAHLGND